MFSKKPTSVEEAQLRELKIISYQLSPLSAFVRAGFILFLAAMATGFVALLAFVLFK